MRLSGILQSLVALLPSTGKTVKEHDLASSRGLQSRAWRIAGIYAVFAALWIYFSDLALSLMVPDPEVIVRWSVYKGIVFVAVTSLLLLWLMRRAFGATEASYEALKSHKQEIERWNRLYAALTDINQTIVMSDEPDSLLESVCTSLVSHGGFQVAWAGCWDDGRQCWALRAASGGRHLISDMLENGSGRFPWEIPIRNGHEWVSNDLLYDEEAREWSENARRHHVRSAAVFPIREGGEIHCVLGVFSEVPGVFRDKVMTLMEQASQDLSFALNNFILAEERREAEAQARHEEHFSNAMIESMPGIVYLYDREGRFLRWNRNFEALSGYSGQEIAAMRPRDFFSTEDWVQVESRIWEVFEYGESSVEADFVSRDGSATPCFFTGRRVVYGEQICLVGIGIDIADRKRMEQNLRDLNDTLEHKVAGRTLELRAAVERAEAADHLKSAFLATMSHELRTPLNSIIGFTGVLLQELPGPLNEEQHRQLDMVRSSAHHLLELINDVLDLSRIEAGQLEIRKEPYELAESVERVVRLVEPMAERKGLNLEVSTPGTLPGMTGDRRRVEQVLINLLNNAVKFTETGSVSLIVDVFPEQEQVRIRIRDTGIGMKQEDQAEVFKPFRQLDSGLSRQHEGTGLGLSICRRLLDLMDGGIDVQSEWQVGTEFTVTLPSGQQAGEDGLSCIAD